MSTYLAIVNNVLTMMRWTPATSSSFADPGEPAAAVKMFVNQAKDYVLSRLDLSLIEKEYLIETKAISTGASLVGSSTNNVITLIGTYPDRDNFRGRKFTSTDTDYFHAGWYRITAQVANQLTLDADGPAAGVTSTDTFYIFQDEYDLDADVRQVLSAWRQSDGTELEIVSEPHYLDVENPGKYQAGSPESIAVYRSPTDAKIWQIQIYPMPTTAEVIRLKTYARLDDLSAYDDEWSLEPEIINMIEIRAARMAFGTKVQADPDLAMTTSMDLKDMITDYRDARYRKDPGRRMRRKGPGESSDNRRARRIVVEGG